MLCFCRKLAALALMVGLAISIANATDVTSGLVGYWPMDEGSGSEVVDASGNGNDGTAQGTNWVNGRYGNGLEFDGVTSIVDIPYTPDMTPSEGATLAAWVFPTDTTRSCIVGQFEGYGMALFYGLQLKSVIWGDDWIMSDVTIPVNAWSYIAMTWDVDNAERMIFLNGDMVGQKGGDDPIPSVQNNFGIGLWVGWPADIWGEDSFQGIIDDVKLWNRILTVDEIKQAGQPLLINIAVDIKPGSDPGSINLKSQGIIRVAILTTNDFDATTVDPPSIKFGPGKATECHGKGHIEDVDEDGDLDMVLHFRTQETGIQPGDTEATLKGEAVIDGSRMLIEGADSITVVGVKASPSPNPRSKLTNNWGNIKSRHN